MPSRWARQSVNSSSNVPRLVSPSSTRSRCARALDQRQSSGCSTRRARSRVALDLARRQRRMRLVHRAGREPHLAGMADPDVPPVDLAGVALVGLADRLGEIIHGRRHRHAVRVIGHQASGPDHEPGSSALLGPDELR
jgi:hypothetical protein